ncbi:MAG: Ig-like domain-containing protein [Clostridia bacterium]
MKIDAIVTTNPAGYEEVFNDLFSYSVDDESIAVVSEDGIITGVSKGTTSVTIKNGEKAQTIDVTVTDLQLLNIFLLILVICTMAIFAILFAFLYLEIF